MNLPEDTTDEKHKDKSLFLPLFFFLSLPFLLLLSLGNNEGENKETKDMTRSRNRNRNSNRNRNKSTPIEDPNRVQYQPECNTRNLRDFLNQNSTALGFLMIAAPFCVMGIMALVIDFSRNANYQLQFGQVGLTFAMVLLAILGLVLLPVIVVAGVRFGKIIFQPTHLLLKPEGIFIHWQQRLSQPSKQLVAWSDITYIDLRQVKDQTRDSEQYIIFKTRQNEKVSEKQIKISSILESSGRTAVLDAIRSYAAEVPRHPEITALLEPPQDSSYTQIWLAALSAPPERESLSPLEPGAILKNTYKIVHKIAMGGQGTAYLASVGDFSIKNKSSPNKQVHSDTERRSGGEAMDSGEAPNTTPEQIVLKEYVLPTQVGSRAKSQSIETLRNEAEILEKLEHKNIVKFLEYFVQDHRGYLVLEHINGKNLREIIKEKGPLEEKEILSLALQMCEMLSYLHSQNPQIIHRDFTPDNLILTDANELKLIDFNVARQNTSTVTATVVGKHSYISLEQFRGKATTQSDIYALGCILHFLSTGQDPEPLTSSSPILLNNDLSPQFNSIVERCTELDSELRYANTAELQKDLAEKFAGTDKIISKIAGTEGMDKIAAADKIADEAS